MIRRLSFIEQQNIVKSRKNVNLDAFHNFVGTIPLDATLQDHNFNLIMDAKLYKWNDATVRAIRRGIELTYGQD